MKIILNSIPIATILVVSGDAASGIRGGDHHGDNNPGRKLAQCGSDWDMQHVESYDGSLGVTRDFVDYHERFVGQLHWNNDLASKYDDPGNVNDVRWCTGTMISDDLMLTAGHCFGRKNGDPNSTFDLIASGTFVPHIFSR